MTIQEVAQAVREMPYGTKAKICRSLRISPQSMKDWFDGVSDVDKATVKRISDEVNRLRALRGG